MDNDQSDSTEKHQVTWRELESLRQNWEQLASRVAEIEANATGQESDTLALDFTEEKLAEIASSIHAARKRRTELFNSSLFGEPAWDMLLVLFICRARSQKLTSSGLCVISNTPHATGLRWIDKLEQQGLVRREHTSRNTRVKWIEITDTGFALMRRYVLDGIARFQMPLPD